MNQPLPISISSEILARAPVFRGTRVPVQTLFDYLESNKTLAEFLVDFPTVTPEQAHEVIELLKHLILTGSYERAA